MKYNPRRGLELANTPQSSDAGRFYRAIAWAACDVEKILSEQIGSENPYSIAGHTERLKTLAEMWFWARAVSVKYEWTPAVLVAVPKYARHIDEWHEDMGVVLWWRDPVEEPPYVGTPHDGDFDETYKWWTPIDIPDMPEKNELKEQ